MTPMNVLITGAGGYIGRAIVAQARARGHGVIAVIRGAGPLPDDWAQDPGIEVCRSDLSQPTDALRVAVLRSDCTIHCAAAMHGTREEFAAGTRAATEAFLPLLPDGAKLVHVSTIAVYDFASQAPGTILDENTPRISDPGLYDGYAAAKLWQEEHVLTVAAERQLDLTIVRPGAVFGPGLIWNVHVGRRIGPLLLRFGRNGQIPLAHISHTAAALVAAAERPACLPVNVIDEDLPDRLRFLGALRPPHAPGLVLPVRAALLRPVMSAGVLAARYRPFGFDNARLQQVLGIRQSKGFERLMHDAQNGATPPDGAQP